MYLLFNRQNRFFVTLLSLFTILLLVISGCGGGGGGDGSGTPPATNITLSGQALGGAPVKGYVCVKDAANPAKTSSAKVNADGSFSLSLDLECQSPLLLWTDGYVNGRSAKLFSQVSLTADQTSATVNINPLTTMVLCAAMGKSAAAVNPETDPAPAQTTVNTTASNLTTVLSGLWTALSASADFDPFTSTFTVGDGVDQFFDLFDLDADAQGAIQVASRHDQAVSVSLDSNGTIVAGDVSVLAAQATADQWMLAQIVAATEKEFELLRTAYPDAATLETELKTPYFAPGYLNNGHTYESFAAKWAGRESGTPMLGSDLVSLSIFRTMKTQTYGNQNIDELADDYDEGIWVLVTGRRNGIDQTYPVSFVNVGENVWKNYGNRREVSSSSLCRPQGYKEIQPGGVVTYEPGFNFYHCDRGDLALNKGITKLAIVNPALPVANVEGQDVHCVQMERRDGGVSDRFGITNVSGDTGSNLRYRDGEGYDDNNLFAQSNPEFTVFALNEADEVQNVWIYPIRVLPHTTDELIEKEVEWFVTLKTPASFEDQSIPGTNRISWDLPADDTIFANWLYFGWYDIDWKYSEVSVDNPAWISDADFFDWLEAEVDASPHSGMVRESLVGLSGCSSEVDRCYIVTRLFDIYTDQIIQPKNNAVELTIDHQWLDTNLSDRLTGVLQPTASNVNRLETKVTVASATTIGEAVEAQTYIMLQYQPDEIWNQSEWSNEKLFEVIVRLNFRDGNMWLQGWVDGYQNVDGSVEYDIPYPEGNYPYDETLVLDREYTIAIECDAAAKTLSYEFNGQRSTVDMSSITDFDPADFKRAQLRARVRHLENPGDSGTITVKYDDVKINGELYDDFNEGLAPNKWQSDSFE